MASTYNIALNFFPLIERSFSFNIYRREYKTGEQSSEFPECRRRKLPKASFLDMEDMPKYGEYWVSFTNQDGFSLYECDSDMNNLVTVDYLYYLL